MDWVYPCHTTAESRIVRIRKREFLSPHLKKVKAIVVHGTKSISVADLASYRKVGMALFEACKEAEGLKPWQDYGTMIVVSWCDEVGALPSRNFSAGSFEGGKTLYGPVMRDQIVITGKGSEKFAIQVKGMEQSGYATHNATATVVRAG
jgi:hypothetical protein